MKKNKLLPFLISILLMSVLLFSITASNNEKENVEETNDSQRSRYTFSLQLFQTI